MSLQRPMLREAAARMHRRAQAVAAGLLAVIFLAFIIQVAFRYVFNLPVGWTSELSVVAWLWLVLWGAAFVVREEDEIRFDLLSDGVGRQARRVMGGICALAVVVLYGMSLPAAYAYVSFMKVERSAYLGIRFDGLYSIFLAFAVAVIVRYLWLLFRVFSPTQPRPAGSDSAGSAP